MKNVKLSPPWDEYVRKLTAFFEQDEEIHIEYKEEENKIQIWVDNTDKYEAMTKLLPAEKDFSGHTIEIEIIPANVLKTEKDNKYYLKKLLKGNEAISQIVEAQMGTAPVTYVEFYRDVVQFWNDNLGDLHGIKSALMEDIARDLFEGVEGVFFGTDVCGYPEE